MHPKATPRNTQRLLKALHGKDRSERISFTEIKFQIQQSADIFSDSLGCQWKLRVKDAIYTLSNSDLIQADFENGTLRVRRGTQLRLKKIEDQIKHITDKKDNYYAFMHAAWRAFCPLSYKTKLELQRELQYIKRVHRQCPSSSSLSDSGSSESDTESDVSNAREEGSGSNPQQHILMDPTTTMSSPQVFIPAAPTTPSHSDFVRPEDAYPSPNSPNESRRSAHLRSPSPLNHSSPSPSCLYDDSIMDRDMEVDHAGDSENASCDIIASCPDATSIWSIYEDETKRSRSIIHKALTKWAETAADNKKLQDKLAQTQSQLQEYSIATRELLEGITFIEQHRCKLQALAQLPLPPTSSL